MGLTLYRTMQTNRLRGMRKKLMMVARISSGTWAARIFIMLGQKRPTQNSNAQKATSWICPWKDMPAQQAALFGSRQAHNEPARDPLHFAHPCNQ